MIKNRLVISFDFGTKSIGIAVGQTITRTARSLKAIKAKDGIPDWLQIEKLFKEWQPDLIVVGLPYNIDGTIQKTTLLAKKFANRIHGRFGLSVQLHDERLSTIEAKAHLFSIGGYKALTKENIDSTAAVVILESWFEENIQ